MIRRAAALVALVLAFPATAAARPGDLDETFSRDGIVRNASHNFTNVATRTNGDVVVLGRAFTGEAESTLRRYLPNGEIDGQFGNGGDVVLHTPGYGFSELAALPDGRVLVAGTTGTGGNDGDFVAVRLLADGSPDPSFGDGGRVTVGFPGFELLGGMAPTGDGGVLLAGGGGDEAGHSEVDVVRLDGNGDLDPAFSGDGRQQVVVDGPDPAYEVSDVVVAPGGSVYVSWGTYYVGQDGARAHVMKLGPDGDLDGSYGDGGIASSVGSASETHEVDDIVLDGAGRVVFAGTPCVGLHVTCFGVIGRFTTDGQPDGTFAGDGVLVQSGTAAVVLPLADTRLLVGGAERGSGPTRSDLTLRMLDVTGMVDNGFAANGLATTDVDFDYDALYDATLDKDQNVVAVGFHVLVRYDMQPGPADADADGHLDDVDRCPKRFSMHRTGCPRFARTLALGRRDDVYLRGRLVVEERLPRDCVQKQPVKLLKRRDGPNRVVAKTETSGREARWYFDRPRGHRQGLYVLAPQRIVPELGRCTRERSPAHDG
jgi:uncharacterized delta-60 repeat protein